MSSILHLLSLLYDPIIICLDSDQYSEYGSGPTTLVLDSEEKAEPSPFWKFCGDSGSGWWSET